MSIAEEVPDTPLASSFKSVADMWHHRVNSTPDSDAMIRQVGGQWEAMSWHEAGVQARSIANGLLASGLEVEQRCAIVAATSVEWVLADMGILCAGGATTTIYPSSTAEQCAYIINDCGAVLIFADNNAQVEKLLRVRDDIPTVKRVVVFDGKPSKDGWVQTLAALERSGDEHAEAHPDAYESASNAITPDRLATLIYTSGTTGKPKGVMLTHDAWVYQGEALDTLGILTPADKQFLFLPLSHVFAKVMEITFIRLGIPTVIDGDIPTLVANLGETSPTWMGAVPRVFEKAYNRIVSQARDAGGVKLQLFEWAVTIGRQVSQLRQQGKEPSGLLKLRYAVADRLVFSKVKERFGGRLRFFISGGAPLSKEIAEFFHACDILILEGYGLTESSAASTLNRLDAYRFGTVGQPLPGCDVQIAEDGEILLKSRGIMRGYYGLQQATAEALTEDGWLRTGDIGVLLDSGHLQITDRKKELIVTAGGKNIAPAHFQNLLKTRSLYVSQVLMHGDTRNFCSALITINEDTVAKWARDNGISFTDYADLSRKPEVRALIQEAIDAINKELPPYETVKKFALLPEDLTQDNDMLTPSLKVKRRVVEAAYAEVLDGFYAGTVAKL